MSRGPSSSIRKCMIASFGGDVLPSQLEQSLPIFLIFVSLSASLVFLLEQNNKRQPEHHLGKCSTKEFSGCFWGSRPGPVTWHRYQQELGMPLGNASLGVPWLPGPPVSTRAPPTQTTWFWLSLGGWAHSSPPAGGLLQTALPSPSSQRPADDPGMGWHILLPRQCRSYEGVLPNDRGLSVSSMELTGHSCLGLSAGPGPPLLCQLSFW